MYYNLYSTFIKSQSIHTIRQKLLKIIKKHLYLRVGAIHGLYRKQVRKEGVTLLDQAVFGEYLKKHRSFIDYRIKNVKFGSNRTSAYFMNYDTLKEQGIDLECFNL